MYVYCKKRTSRNHLKYGLSIDKPVVIVHPGETAYFTAWVSGVRHKVRLILQGLETHNIGHIITPIYGIAPFTARIELRTSRRTSPGVYVFRLTAVNVMSNNIIGEKELTLIVLPENLAYSNYIKEAIKLHKKFGMQAAIWYLIKHMHPYGAAFTQIKKLYEFLIGRRISNGTVGDLLNRMIRKGFIEYRNGVYVAKMDIDYVRKLVDARRAINGMKGARAFLGDNKKLHKKHDREQRLPRPIKRLFKIARKLVQKGEYEKALDLLEHTVIGVRRTGKWIAWINEYFIYYEKKTGFWHYFKSPKLAQLLKHLGIREGFIHSGDANDIIREMFHSYKNARRIHYWLKELGWLCYGPPILVETLFYKDKSIGIALKNSDGELVASFNYKPDDALKRKNIPAYGGEHIDEENEDTYFNRSGLW